MTLSPRGFGDTGLIVSPLGFGAGEIGEVALDERDAESLLRTAVELGVTLIDTARSYGLSEQRIGRYLGPVRDQIVLSTKIGYGIDGVADWTAECITLGVERALRELATDRIDIVHLHSCPVEILARGDVIAALLAARDAGKLRCAAYSGDNEALAWAADSHQFDALQMSWNLCDQRAAPILERAHAAGLGVIAKRPLANAPWRFAERPAGHEAEAYWERWQALAPSQIAELPADELAMRFAAHTPGISSAIVGTRSLAHLRANLDLVSRGPLPITDVVALRARFAALGASWPSRV